MASPKLAPNHAFQLRDTKHMTRTNNLPGKRHWVPGKDETQDAFLDAYEDGAKIAADLVQAPASDTWWGGPTRAARREVAEGDALSVPTAIGALQGPVPGANAGLGVFAGADPEFVQGALGSAQRGYEAHGVRGALSDLASTAYENATPGSLGKLVASGLGGYGAAKSVAPLLSAMTPGGLSIPATAGLGRFVPKGLGPAVAANAAIGNTLGVAQEYDQALHGGADALSEDIGERAAEYRRTGNPGVGSQLAAAGQVVMGAPQNYLNQQRAQLTNAGVYGDAPLQAAADKAFTYDNTAQYPQLVQQHLDAYRKTFQPGDFDSPEAYQQATQTMAEIAAAQRSNARWSNGRGFDPHTQGPTAFQRHLDAGEIPGIQPGTPSAQLAQHLGNELGGGIAWNPKGGYLSDPATLQAVQRASARPDFQITPTGHLPVANTAPNYKAPAVPVGVVPPAPTPQAGTAPAPK